MIRPERLIDILRHSRFVGSKDKIRHGVRKCEAKLTKPYLCLFSRTDNLLRRLFKIRLVFHSLCPQDLGRHIHGIGIVRVFHVI